MPAILSQWKDATISAADEAGSSMLIMYNLAKQCEKACSYNSFMLIRPAHRSTSLLPGQNAISSWAAPGSFWQDNLHRVRLHQIPPICDFFTKVIEPCVHITICKDQPRAMPLCVKIRFRRKPHALFLSFCALWQVQVACVLIVHPILVLSDSTAEQLTCKGVEAVRHCA